MNALIRSEALKQRTTRSTTLLLAWMSGLILVIVALHVASFDLRTLRSGDSQHKILGLGTTIAALFGALAGAISVTGEFRSGTIRPTLLITPHRSRVLVAKLFASTTVGFGIGLAALILTAGTEAAGLAIRGVDIRLSAGDYGQAVIGGAIAAALFGAMGAALGAAVRNQVAVLVGLCVWLLFVEPLLLGNAPDIGRYAPVACAGAVAGAIQTQIAGDLVGPALGLLLLAAYAGLLALIGNHLLVQRDID